MQGCPLRCIYCHNRDTWSIDGGKEVSVDDIIIELNKYKDFIKLSGGGITVTGGEPTLQAEFVTELFKKCRKLGIHTAIDTSGFVEIEHVEELLNYVDLVLLDIKHGKNDKHIEITGVSNEKTIKFGKYVSNKGIDIWIRYVLLPGVTNSIEDLKDAKYIINSFNTVKKVEVLPYHKMGEYKWEEYNETYRLKNARIPTIEEVKEAQKVLKIGV